MIRHLVALLPPLAAVIALVAYHEGKQHGLRACPGKPLSVVMDGRTKVCVYTPETLHHKPVRKEFT